MQQGIETCPDLPQALLHLWPSISGAHSLPSLDEEVPN